LGIQIRDAAIADGPPGTIIKRLGIKGFLRRDQFNYDYHMRFGLAEIFGNTSYIATLN
jgi:hypothetical protein